MTEMDTVCEFSAGEVVYYPTHGVGQMVRLDNINVEGIYIPTYVVEFPRTEMTLTVPVDKAASNGLVPLSNFADRQSLKRAIKVIIGKRKIHKGMWSRRMKYFEDSVSLGGLNELALAIRDLNRNADEDTQSYSERVLLNDYAKRLLDMLMPVWGTSEPVATKRLNKTLSEAGKQTLDFW